MPRPPCPLASPRSTPRPERAIAKGEEVLHTYGDLSDAQLLQTYGFLEQLPGGCSANPHNYALLPYRLLLDGARRTLGGAEAAAVVGGALLRKKESLLGAAGLLQAAAPGETEFVATAAEPLSDELLTTVQVRRGGPGGRGCARRSRRRRAAWPLQYGAVGDGRVGGGLFMCLLVG
jgi:hypothetical protein